MELIYMKFGAVIYLDFFIVDTIREVPPSPAHHPSPPSPCLLLSGHRHIVVCAYGFCIRVWLISLPCFI